MNSPLDFLHWQFGMERCVSASTVPGLLKGVPMSKTMLIEAQSSDPYVRQLARSAIRLLNDPTLDRWQRERHIRRLQKLLLEHQVKAEAKASREAHKAERKTVSQGQSSTLQGSAQADASQIKARRKELEGQLPSVPQALAVPAVARPVLKVRLTRKPQPVEHNLVQVEVGQASNAPAAQERKRA